MEERNMKRKTGTSSSAEVKRGEMKDESHRGRWIPSRLARGGTRRAKASGFSRGCKTQVIHPSRNWAINLFGVTSRLRLGVKVQLVQCS